jgi:hypothetical protein
MDRVALGPDHRDRAEEQYDPERGGEEPSLAGLLLGGHRLRLAHDRVKIARTTRGDGSTRAAVRKSGSAQRFRAPLAWRTT